MTKEELANRAVFPMGKENTAFAQYFQGQSYLNAHDRGSGHWKCNL